MESIKYRIIDEVFGLEAIDWPARHVNHTFTSVFLCVNRAPHRYRTSRAKAIPPPPLARAKDAPAPAVPYAALAGAYTHPAYGTIDFCLFAENKTTGSACASLAEDVAAARLPGVIEPEVPTLLARWDTMVTNYIRLAHYAGDLFNLTAVQNYVRVSLLEMVA